MRAGIKLIALVCILGIAAYLLFSPKSTEPDRVSARQHRVQSPPLPDAHSLALLPTAPAHIESSPKSSPKVSTTHPVGSAQSIAGLPAAIASASVSQQNTANRLMDFTSTGKMSDVRNLTAEEVRSLAELLTAKLGPETVAAAVEASLGLPAASLAAHGNVAEALTELFQAVQSDTAPSTARPLVFSDQVRPDGSVSGNVHVIPAGTKRVYAAFENTGPLQGLDHVLAVWRNPSDDRMVFSQYEPVRVGATYNYVWLELDNGWPAGFYQLDLFHPFNPSQLLASRTFNVR